MSRIVPIAQVTISPNRQRREFDPEALIDLQNSISAHGLLHPIVVREEGEKLILVAGERRFRAISDMQALGETFCFNNSLLPSGQIPIVTLGELEPLAAEEAELDENLRRVDLSWQEEAAAVDRLHKLRVAQAEALGRTHTHTNTAEEIHNRTRQGLAFTPDVVNRTRQTLSIADHLDNPVIAQAKTAKEAFKLLKKDEQAKRMTALGEKVGATFNSSAHSLHHIDCLQWLGTCPLNSFDVILTDPPYGMGADKFGDAAGKLVTQDHSYADDKTTWNKLMWPLMPLLFRVAKPQAHAYLFCDLDNFHELKELMQAAGWYVFRTPLIAYKPNSGRVPLPEHGPRRQWEMILYAIKGNKPVNAIYSDVIPCTLEETLNHGAQKPVSLYTDLLRRSIRPGDTVLDPFAGTGTIFPAAHQFRARATGLELNPEYYGICVQRLNGLDAEPSLV